MTEKYSLGPVVGVEVYREDIVVKRQGKRGVIEQDVLTIRGEVKEFTRKSRDNLRFVASNTPVRFLTMITLTYPGEYSNDGKEVKRHLHAFLQWMRRRWESVEYLWFIEFQRRGAPHYHILIDHCRKTDDIADVAMAWYRIVGSNDPAHLAAGTSTERIRKLCGARNYATKYASKMRQKSVPDSYRDVGRFWGCSKNVRPKPCYTIGIDDISLRYVLKGWKYLPRSDRPLYRVLFGTAKVLTMFGDSVKMSLSDISSVDVDSQFSMKEDDSAVP